MSIPRETASRNVDSAEYLLHYDGVADQWRPLAPSPDEVWFDSFPNCDPPDAPGSRAAQL
jgi:hypothetical protein